MPNFRGTRRSLLGPPPFLDQTRLLKIGPYATNPSPSVSGLSDLILVADIYDGDNTQTRTNPLKFGTVSLSDGSVLDVAQSFTSSLFLWCDTFSCDGTSNVSVYGNDGGDAGISDPTSGPVIGGDGGLGAGGGGGGGAVDAGSGSDGIGGAGGTRGVNGQNGTSDGAGDDIAGSGGASISSNYGFAFPLGGNASSGGLGFSGGGGGGNGGTAPANGFEFAAGGGGGGGGGLFSCVARVANFISGPTIQAFGGAGGIALGGGANDGCGAGGGSVYLAFMKKTGNFAINVSGGPSSIATGLPGNYVLYEIRKNGSLVLHTNLNDHWDNT